MVVAKFRIDYAAVIIDHHFLVQRGAKRLRDPALDLSTALHRIGDPAGIRGVNAFQDLDLSGALVHRNAKALHVEGHRPRRARRCAGRTEGLALRARGFRELNIRHVLPAADCGIVFKDAGIGICFCRGSSKYPEIVGQIFRCGLRRASGDKRPGTAIGAGVVTAMRRVGLQQANLIDGGRQRSRRDLAMHRRGAVAELGGANHQFEAAILAQRNPGIGKMAVRRHRVDHGQRNALAGQPVVGKFDLRCFDLHRALDQIEALIEPVRAIKHVGMRWTGRRQHRIARFHHVAATDFVSADAKALGQLVDRGFHREQRLRQAIPPEGAGRHGVGIGDDGIDLLVCAIIDAKRLAAGMEQHRSGVIAVGAGI